MGSHSFIHSFICRRRAIPMILGIDGEILTIKDTNERLAPSKTEWLVWSNAMDIFD
jgi:hypothetical protein